MKACPATPVTPGELCVNESGEMAFTRGPHGPMCARCCRSMDAINLDRARAGLAPEAPDWARYKQHPSKLFARA